MEIPSRKDKPNIEIILAMSELNNPLAKIWVIFSNPPKACTAEYDSPRIDNIAVLVPKKSEIRALKRSILKANKCVA